MCNFQCFLMQNEQPYLFNKCLANQFTLDLSKSFLFESKTCLREECLPEDVLLFSQGLKAGLHMFLKRLATVIQGFHSYYNTYISCQYLSWNLLISSF